MDPLRMPNQWLRASLRRKSRIALSCFPPGQIVRELLLAFYLQVRFVAIRGLASLAFGGTLVIAGYAGGREAEVNVTDIIWKAATVRGFTFRLFAPQTVAAANAALLACLEEGTRQPTTGNVFPMSAAADAVRYLLEDRPFGRVLMHADHEAALPSWPSTHPQHSMG